MSISTDPLAPTAGGMQGSAGTWSRLAAGGRWVVMGKAVAAGTTVLANAILARFLAPAELGAYFLLLSLVLTLANTSHLGMNHAVIRFTAEAMGRQDEGRARLALSRSILVGGAGALAGGAVLLGPSGAWLAGIFTSPLLASVLPPAAIWLVAFAVQNLLAEAFRGLHDIRMSTLFSGTLYGVINVALFGAAWIIWRNGSLRHVVTLSSISATAVAVIAVAVIARRIRPMRRGGELPFAELLRAGIPLWISTLTLYAISQMDLWIMGATRAPAEVAVYGAAARLVTTLAMPLLIVNAVLPPVIADLYGRGEVARLEETLRRTAALAALPALAVMVLITVFGRQLLELVYGPYYRAGWIVLLILGVGQLINVLAGSCGTTLMMTGHQNTMMFISVFSATLMAVLAIVLGSRWGGVGVAVAAATGITVQNILMWTFAKRLTGLRTHAAIFSWRGALGKR